ncbi:MAG: FAD-dependent oxidoreductase [Bacteroidales bacterium]|nr:FAD-dependent oxidoreductase [Bacteroidales bacterium]
MIKLKIDNQAVEVPKGTTVLEACQSIGINIPTMCYLKGYSNRPSCMVCLVKDTRNGNLHPSCALPVSQGMDIISTDDEIIKARKEALELLLSDHVGDCEAPCRIACPAYMDIPKMNRLIAKSDFRQALELVKEEIALPLILGYICSAPCEKVCRRKDADQAISICQLKKFVAAEDLQTDEPFLPVCKKPANKTVAIIGSGPAGLSCAWHLQREGYSCTLFDQNQMAGGSLRNNTMKKELPIEALDAEINIIRNMGAEFRTNTEITAEYFENTLYNKYDAVVIAIGNSESPLINQLGFHYNEKGTLANRDTYETGVSGVFACGSVINPLSMAVKAIAQGKEAVHSVIQYLSDEQIHKMKRPFNSKFGRLQTDEVLEYLKEASSNEITIPEAGDLSGFNPEEAIKEAERCMHCDCRKPDSCKLRIYANEYGADRKKYLYGERKTLTKQVQHEFVIFETEKCIRCSLCVDITTQNKELTGLTQIGRGFDVKIAVPFNKSLGEALTITAQKCIEACPTGALSYKIDNY